MGVEVSRCSDIFIYRLAILLILYAKESLGLHSLIFMECALSVMTFKCLFCITDIKTVDIANPGKEGVSQRSRLSEYAKLHHLILQLVQNQIFCNENVKVTCDTDRSGTVQASLCTHSTSHPQKSSTERTRCENKSKKKMIRINKQTRSRAGAGSLKRIQQY